MDFSSSGSGGTEPRSGRLAHLIDRSISSSGPTARAVPPGFPFYRLLRGPLPDFHRRRPRPHRHAADRQARGTGQATASRPCPGPRALSRRRSGGKATPGSERYARARQVPALGRVGHPPDETQKSPHGHCQVPDRCPRLPVRHSRCPGRASRSVPPPFSNPDPVRRSRPRGRPPAAQAGPVFFDPLYPARPAPPPPRSRSPRGPPASGSGSSVPPNRQVLANTCASASKSMSAAVIPSGSPGQDGVFRAVPSSHRPCISSSSHFL